jgi:hypothetical protein
LTSTLVLAGLDLSSPSSFIGGLRPFLRSRGGWGLAVSGSRQASSTKHSPRLCPRLLSVLLVRTTYGSRVEVVWLDAGFPGLSFQNILRNTECRTMPCVIPLMTWELAGFDGRNSASPSTVQWLSPCKFWKETDELYSTPFLSPRAHSVLRPWIGRVWAVMRDQGRTTRSRKP